MTKKYGYLDGDGPTAHNPNTGLEIDVDSEMDFNGSINFNDPANT